MELSEAVGAVLFDAADPVASSLVLRQLLDEPSASDEEARSAGFAPALVAALRPLLAKDARNTESVCAAGAGWVLGRRSVSTSPEWEPVLTQAPGLGLPAGATRRTLESFVGLMNEGTTRIRLAAPFVDETASEYLAGPLGAALERGVTVQILMSRWSRRTRRACDALFMRIVPNLRPGLSLDVARQDGPWPHLKVMTVDGRAAYVGSANLTRRGLAEGNLELGILLRGSRVALIDAILDTIAVKDNG